MTVDEPSENSKRTVLDGQVYNVHCESSSDFVVGRQTNFHAPVTIINCPSPKTDGTPDNIILRDNLWTNHGVATLQSQISPSNINLSVKTEHPCKNEKHDCKKLLTKEKLQQMTKAVFFGMPLFVWLILFIILTCCTIAVIVEFPRDDPIGDKGAPINDKILIGNHSNYFISKKAWGGLNASSVIEIDSPTLYVVISHTAGHFCYESKSCANIMRDTQKDHLSRDPPFADIAYSFMVGGDGNIYEGRGWGVRSPHGGFVDNRNIGIGLIGDFSVTEIPTKPQMMGVQALIEWGVRDCWLRPDYILMAHSALVATLSPGRNIMNIISKWPHFDPDPKAHLPRETAPLNVTCHHMPRVK